MSRILVIDDEPRIASFVSRALSAEGFRVDATGDGERALQLTKTGAYGLVVLDLLLPGRDGISVLQGIMEHRPEQRVFVLSALSDVETKVRCLELGASDYLAKPFALAELVARVRARLREPAVKAPDRTLSVGPVVLDMVRRAASSEHGSAVLTDREFALLHHLMREDGEVCSRERLLADVWGLSFETGSNVVDVYVGRLRSKLGDEVIETVRNVGYRLNVA
jgi:two-component system copper resistance phosphate regulon response regulator CusR